jgi:hypothetical protein
MVTPPRAPDWYPDPSGGPGLIYWDGRQWHREIPADPAPAERPPDPPISAAPSPRHQTALITALLVAVAVLFGIVGITSYLLLKQPSRSQTPVAEPAPVPSAQQPTPATSVQQPAPTTSNALPTSQNFTTPSGKICLVTAQQVTCQACMPGHVITSVYTCPDPAPAVAVNTQGIVDRSPPDMASPPQTQQLSSGQTYHASGWTIVASGGWARFINDKTGHGMAIAGQNFDSY